MPDGPSPTRRGLLQAGALLPVAAVLASCGEDEDAARAASPASAGTPATLAATPSCGDGDADPTEAQTEGPYFTPGSPQRRSLLQRGVRGSRLIVTGRVLTTDCRPAARALLDVWQADGRGVYDNRGYRLRGHQFTDAQGRYRLETVFPGLYPGRTRHIHVKVQARGGPILTTQIYFPGVPQNASDGIFDPDLLVSLRRSGGVRRARFDFVVER